MTSRVDANPSAEAAKPFVGCGAVATSADFWRVQLEAIYRQRNPYKLDRVPTLLEKYRGREVLLYRKVCNQYDLNPMTFYAGPDAVELDSEAAAKTAPKRESAAMRFVGLVSDATAAFSRRVGRLFGLAGCESDDDTACALGPLQPEAACSPPRGHWRARRESLVEGTPPLSPLGTQFTPVPRRQLTRCNHPKPPDVIIGETARALSFEPAQELRPTRVCASSASVATASAQEAACVRTSADFWRANLDAIYRRRNPYKLYRVPSFLEKYKGQEILLYRKVCKQYDLDPTKFYADSSAWEQDMNEDQQHQQCDSDGSDDILGHEADGHQHDLGCKAREPWQRPVKSSPFAFEFNSGGAAFSQKVLPPSNDHVAATVKAPTAFSVGHGLASAVQQPTKSSGTQRLQPTVAPSITAPAQRAIEGAGPLPPKVNVKRKFGCDGEMPVGRVAAAAAAWEARCAKAPRLGNAPEVASRRLPRDACERGA